MGHLDDKYNKFSNTEEINFAMQYYWYISWWLWLWWFVCTPVKGNEKVPPMIPLE